MPRILSRKEIVISPWVRLVAKEVEFAPGQKPEIYHAVRQADYISILAVTRTGLIPVIKQYRPAVEEFTYELPAGLVDPGENPEETCRRELMEETGLTAISVLNVGAFFTDTGRFENHVHVFQVEASDPDEHFVPEPGLSVEFLTREGLRDYIRRGLFKHQLHLGALASAAISGNWSL
jgi:ADP-ribose pyrophosphatase